jgi:16S rRNA (guanine527-N7)-methyltransferase
VSRGSIDELEKTFNDLVMEWNKKINLVSRLKTNIYDLIEDSKLFGDFIDFRAGLQLLDLGTGAGIPGIVIKIHHPEIQLTLVDSIRKKINAVNDIVSRLGLNDVEVICARAEELGRQSEYKNKFDYIVARSVSSLDNTVKWSKCLIKPGGRLVTVKGEDVEEELRRTKRLKYVENIAVNIQKEKNAITVKFV